MKEAAKFLNCSQDYITYLAKTKKARRDGWIVEKIQLKYRFKCIQKFNLCIKWINTLLNTFKFLKTILEIIN